MHGRYSFIWISRNRDVANPYVAVKVFIPNNTINYNTEGNSPKYFHADDKRASMILPILDESVLNSPNS